MAKHKIISVIGTDNLHTLFPNNEDKVFFSKEQLRVGSKLVYMGRHAPNTIWEVTNIWWFNRVRGQYRSHKTDTVQYLNDAVEVTCVSADNKVKVGQIMELTFQYLSYSAIWRLV